MDSRILFTEVEKSYFQQSENQNQIIASFEIITLSCWVRKN